MDSHYYYLHTNGSLIHKPGIVVESDPQYFDSDFVKKYWKLDLTNRANAWQVATESLALGANIEEVRRIADRWELTREDMKEYVTRVTNPTELERKGIVMFIEHILGDNVEEFWKSIAPSVTN